MRVLHREARLAGIVAHPPDSEDGVRYESVFAEARRLGVPALRAAGKSPELADFAARLAPDLIWITDYRYLLPTAVLAQARLGAVNLHPSLLPKFRGRAPVNWAILHGEHQLGLTAHFVDEGMDTGDIIAQRTYRLAQSQDVGDALDILYPHYESLSAEVLACFNSGTVPRKAQDGTQATAFPRRTPEDGRIDWTAPAREVWNLIRAVAAPYPGAFAQWPDGRIRIWKASGLRNFGSNVRPAPGELLEVSADSRTITMACADAALVITSFTLEMGATLPVTASAKTGGHIP